jgi:hypothetical protein
MINISDIAVEYVASFFGGRVDIGANIVSNALWAIPSACVSIAVYFRKRRAKIPLKIFMLYALFKMTRGLRWVHRPTLDGFYYAVYDASNSSKVSEAIESGEDDQSGYSVDEVRPADGVEHAVNRGKGTKVAECIYIRTALFSSRMTGYVFRRAKRKNNKIVQNNYYLDDSDDMIVNKIRIVGRFSYRLEIFFGYWLDPYTPDDVAGTVRLKWVNNNNTGIQRNHRRIYMIGHWVGVRNGEQTLVNEANQQYYGYAEVGGIWKFHRIAEGLSEFARWRDGLSSIGDCPQNPSEFLEWNPK